MKQFLAIVFGLLIALTIVDTSSYVSAAPSAGILRGVKATSSSPDVDTSVLTDGNLATHTTFFGGRYAEWVLKNPHNVKAYYFNSPANVNVLLYDTDNKLLVTLKPTESSYGKEPNNLYVPVEYNNVKKIRIQHDGSIYHRTVLEIDIIADEIDLSPPDVPLGFKGTSKLLAVDFSWTKVDKAAGYNIYKNGVKVNEKLITSNNFTLTDLEPDVNFAYQITAVSQLSVESAKSSVIYVSAMGDEVKPELIASNITDSSVRLSWTNVAPNFEIYQDGVLISKPTTHLKFIDVTGLEPSKSYTFKIIAIDRYGRRVPSDNLTITTLVGMPVKSQITVKDITHNSALVTWTKSSNTNEWSLYIDDVLIQRGTQLSYAAKNLNSNQIYKVRVVSHGIDDKNAEASVSFTTLKPPVPIVNHAKVENRPGYLAGDKQKQLTYTASDDVTGVNVYVNGHLVGTYPKGEDIFLDFSQLEGLTAEIEVEPVDPEGQSYKMSSPIDSTGAELADDLIGKFLDMLGVQRNAFTYLALISIPLFILVALFFWLRRKLKPMVKDKDDDKPFGVVNQANPKAIKQASQAFRVDTTKDERRVYQDKKMPKYTREDYRSEPKYKRLGFQIEKYEEKIVPVGFMGVGGYKKKVDITYRKNDVLYKNVYVRGQGRVYKPIDTKNQLKHVSNQFKAVKTAFTGSNKSKKF